jgi:hypothetical protein
MPKWLDLQKVLPPRPLNRKECIAFVAFMASDEATRQGTRGHRQKLPMRGRHVTWSGKSYLRGSDRSERIYVSVRALEYAGESNQQACRVVAPWWALELGKSQRGRPKRHQRTPDLLDTVETVRSVYNSFKARAIPGKKRLPNRDFVYVQWYFRFRFFQQWFGGLLHDPIRRRMNGQAFAESLLARSRGGPIIHEAVTSLTRDGIVAMLETLPHQGSDQTQAEIEQFADEFLAFVPTTKQRGNKL